MLDNQDLQAIKQLLDEGFGLVEGSIDGKLGSLEGRIDGKLNALEKRVDERFTEQENSLLAEIDFIQEKANGHFKRIENRMDEMQNDINGLRQDNGMMNILFEKVMKVSEEVEIIKQKIS